ncbi:tRNA guanosine(34) transglycosylase Tgt [bacterium]|jgi:queuine tRNA-ribosyltransferase|nr:tRNA guanosine(34) transglycosylase Tgt [bacterium]MDP6571560.1 tRNA guanosine(34) transglycosylase Tgt [Patescibacteria group bacterium]MDP6756135.1 tRNA guanosine(34) transglycosylase Tgt [Patescibacteria group bacterium]|tara:strand:+ start:11037 stop:12149 length:1113 start_codon:yes stop_codon:yes gene_type:complete
MFKITKQSKKSQARTGVLKTAHGSVQTPFFMPIATKGAVKSLTSDDIRRLKAQIILSNTYHQLLRPGLEVLKKAKGLHKFMDWDKPMLTDSGGFQVFSLTKIRKILPNGVKFRSHIDGREFLLTPKKALEIQKVIGSDIRMVLDVCPSYGCSKKESQSAVDLTTKWAKESKKFKSKDRSLLFAIVQGSTSKDLRLKSAKELVDLNFDGYAIGGLAVGEPGKEMLNVLDYTVPALPKDRPRYLMGLGFPEQIVEAVKRGIDMFDCVIPTREARHGRIYSFRYPDRAYSRVEGSRGKLYDAVSITNAKFAKDFSPINPSSKVRELKMYTKAYLHHLFKTQEPVSIRLASLNNVEFYLELMQRLRVAVKKGEV